MLGVDVERQTSPMLAVSDGADRLSVSRKELTLAELSLQSV
jgi:hypothetical protein